MNNIMQIYLICICIEVYHIICHKQLSMFENDIIENLNNLDLAEKMLWTRPKLNSHCWRNKKMEQVFGEDIQFNTGVLDRKAIKHYISRKRDKLFDMYSNTYIYCFFIAQLIEVIYLLLSLMLVVSGTISFYAGTAVVLFSIIKRLDIFKFENRNLFDSTCCILIFLFCMCMEII